MDETDVEKLKASREAYRRAARSWETLFNDRNQRLREAEARISDAMQAIGNQCDCACECLPGDCDDECDPCVPCCMRVILRRRASELPAEEATL